MSQFRRRALLLQLLVAFLCISSFSLISGSGSGFVSHSKIVAAGPWMRRTAPKASSSGAQAVEAPTQSAPESSCEHTVRVDDSGLGQARTAHVASGNVAGANRLGGRIQQIRAMQASPTSAVFRDLTLSQRLNMSSSWVRYSSLAATGGAVAALPTMQEETDPSTGDIKWGHTLMVDSAGGAVQVPSVHKGTDDSSLALLFIDIDRYATAAGAAGGFPVMGELNGQTHDAFLLDAAAAERLDAPLSELESDVLGGVGSMSGRFRAISQWCLGRGFAAGFPNMQEGKGNSTAVGTSQNTIGAVCIREGFGRTGGVFAYQQYFYQNFDFNAYPRRALDELLSAHAVIVATLAGCRFLTQQVTAGGPTYADLLKTTYLTEKLIHRELESSPNEAGTVTVGRWVGEVGQKGREWIDINIAFMEARGSPAFMQQTLIHEMMHAAGTSHPRATDEDAAMGYAYCALPEGTSSSSAYLDSPPMQAECCIDESEDIDTPSGCPVVPCASGLTCSAGVCMGGDLAGPTCSEANPDGFCSRSGDRCDQGRCVQSSDAGRVAADGMRFLALPLLLAAALLH